MKQSTATERISGQGTGRVVRELTEEQTAKAARLILGREMLPGETLEIVKIVK